MMTKKVKKIAIVMDEIDEMNNGDKRGITSLIKLIRQKKTKKQKLEHVTLNPIICIGNYYVDKKMKELKKVCHVFELKPPNRQQITKILQLITNKQTQSYLNDTRAQNIVVDFVQGDLRKFVFIENMLKNRPEFLEDTAVLESVFQIKTYNDDTKKITQQLLKQYIPLELHNQILNETDRTIISLLYHENIVDHLWYNSSTNNTSTIQFYSKFLENLCFADNTDRITFQNQIWIFNEMSSMIKTFYNNFLYHKKYNGVGNSLNSTSDDIRFTKVLTKYSTEYNNQLFLYNMCQEMDMDKTDVVAFFQELLLLLCPTVEEPSHHNNLQTKGLLTEKDKSCTNPTASGLMTSVGKGTTPMSTIYDQLDELFQATEISRLDIKRMYRFLDKNSETFDINIGKKASTYLSYNMMDGESNEDNQYETDELI
jgi:hypothetical protein